jgi:hypothetical protein
VDGNSRVLELSRLVSRFANPDQVRHRVLAHLLDIQVQVPLSGGVHDEEPELGPDLQERRFGPDGSSHRAVCRSISILDHGAAVAAISVEISVAADVAVDVAVDAAAAFVDRRTCWFDSHAVRHRGWLISFFDYFLF